MRKRLRSASAELLRIGRQHAGLLILLAMYLGVTLCYGLLNPLGEGPDEVANLELIQFISREGHLPRTYAEREAAGYKSDWPQLLYHAPVGLATRWINHDASPRLKVLDNHLPRRLMVEDELARFALVHTADERFPFRGVVLLWHVARVVATLFSTASLVITYLIILTILPGQRMLALGGTAAAAAMPEFHFLASVAHEDNVLALFAALFTLALIRAWQRPDSRRSFLWLGVWFGLALTTKYSVGLLPLLVLAVLAGAVRRRRLAWQAAGRRLLLFGAAAAAVGVWWFVYVEWHFNQIEELGLVAGLLKPVMASGIDASMRRVAALITGGAISAPVAGPATGVTLWDLTMTLFRPFWFIKWPAGDLVMAAIALAFLALLVLAAAGLWRARRRGDPLPWPVLGLLALQIGLLLPFPLLRLYLTRNPTLAAQARHILVPATAAVGLLLTLGISAWLPAARRRWAGIGLSGILLAVSLASFFGYVRPLFPPVLPVLTSPGAAGDVPNPIHQRMAAGIELAGYQIGEINPYGVLPVALTWRSLDYVNQDRLVELSLLDEARTVRSLWLGHPVNGHYPTRAWDPGDLIYDTIWLPVSGLDAGEYQVRLRLRPAFGPAEEVTAESGVTLLSTLHLEPPALSSRVPTVWQDGQPAGKPPTFRYRAAVSITGPPAPGSDAQASSTPPVALVGPDAVERAPHAQAGNTYIFLVGADWPSGSYRVPVPGDRAAAADNPSLNVEVRPRNFFTPPMAQQVQANFGDEIMLLGYDFPERRAEPGAALPITLYWQALKPIGRPYVVSNHLLHQADLRQWGGADRIPLYYYSPMLWAPGEIVRDEYLVPVDPSAPPGVYALDIGLYLELAGQTRHVPLVRDEQVLEANSVSIAPIKVGGPPPGVTVQDPQPQYRRAENLGDFITFLGYDVQVEADALDLVLFWRCDQVLPADYTTFVHVRDPSGHITGQPGEIVAQMDQPPADGSYPTSLWSPGEVIRDPVRVPFPSSLSPGTYEIIVGLYRPDNNSRLPVLNAQHEVLGDYVQLAPIQVPRQWSRTP